jgi:tetratricopeptide (TPR) repeat protein
LVTRMLRFFFNAKKFAETRQFEEAHKEIDKVIAIDSKIPQAFAMKGGIYFLQGSLDQSIANYKKVLELDPSYNEAIQMIDKIKAKSGAPR